MLTFVDAREIALRPYQGSVVERLREKIRQRIKRLILCATTGAGKTLISAYLIKEAAKKGSYVLFIVDRVALVEQTSAVFDEYGIRHGIVQGTFHDASKTLQTVVGSRRRVIAWGAPFGSGGNLLEWWGPGNIALGSMTTANGDNGRMTFAPYVFDNVIASKSGGARAFDGAPGWLSAETTIPNIPAGAFISISGAIRGGTYGAPGFFTVIVTLTETDSAGTRTILTTSAQGHAETDQSGQGYMISTEPAWSATGQGLKGGSVTYRLATSMSGPGYANNGSIRGSITVLPQI